MIEIMKVKGSNGYKIPYCKNDMQQRQGGYATKL